MKTLLLLAIFCAVSYASISPKWTDVNNGGTQNFNWTDVTAQSSPVKGEWTTINYCGVANVPLNYTSFTYEVGINYNTQQKHIYKAGSVRLIGDKTSFAGVPDCEFFSFQVPDFDGSKFYVVLNLYAIHAYSSSYQSSVKIEFDV